MLSKVKSYIKSHNLLHHNDLYVVALSGGADSVALLLLLDEMGYQVHAAHCNFHLRGEESDRDELFCEQLCLQKNIPFHRVHFDTQTYAETHKVSIEMAARELRYHYFEQLRKDIGAMGICVAHHRDDSVETVLLNMVRGTGLRGLCGIQPRNGYILRPLLCISRKDIEGYLQEKGQAYVTDSTNLQDDVLRNKVRLNVLPMLQELNPAVSEHIQQMAENLTEAQKVIDAVVDTFKNDTTLDLKNLDKYGSREYIAFEWLKDYGFNSSQVAQILKAKTGSVFYSPTGQQIFSNRGTIFLQLSNNQPPTPLRIPEEGNYWLDNNTKITIKKEPVWISKKTDIATFDSSKVKFPLIVRPVKKGDWMIPFGMKGRKLLSDMMTDLKMSIPEKRQQLVVEDADGNILWLVGIRTDNRYQVSEETKEVMSINFVNIS